MPKWLVKRCYLAKLRLHIRYDQFLTKRKGKNEKSIAD